MKSFYHLILIPCVLVLLSFRADAQESFTIGDATLSIPAPPGFVRIDGKNKEWDAMMARFVPPSNRFLCTFGTPKDLSDLQAGKFPTSPQSFQLQTFIKAEKMTVSIKDFEQAKEEIRKMNIGETMKTEAQNMVNKANSSIQKQTGVPVDLKIGETRQLGVFDETDTSISFAAVMNLGVSAANQSQNVTMFMAGCTVVVKGKILFLYSYAESTQPGAEEWVKKNVTDWKESILAANPGGTPKGGLFDKVGRGALIGAGIGLGIALLNKMTSRKDA